MRHLEVSKAAASRSLVTLDEVKAHLGITDSSQDAALTGLIGVAGALVAGGQGLDRDPWRQSYLERLAGDGGIYLHLARWPIESIASIKQWDEEIDPSFYEVALVDRSVVYAEACWRYTWPVQQYTPVGTGIRPVPYEVAYTAGWLMPDEISDWGQNTAYAAGHFARSSDPTRVLRFEATTAGTSGATEPTWPAEEGEEVVDGSVTWTARAASELPVDLRHAAVLLVADLFSGSFADRGDVRSESFEGMSIQYADRQSAMAEAVFQVARSYR